MGNKAGLCKKTPEKLLQEEYKNNNKILELLSKKPNCSEINYVKIKKKHRTNYCANRKRRYTRSVGSKNSNFLKRYQR